ncbi:hypothetical protein ACLOJK_010880 [Asimina triloba]
MPVILYMLFFLVGILMGHHRGWARMAGYIIAMMVWLPIHMSLSTLLGISAEGLLRFPPGIIKKELSPSGLAVPSELESSKNGEEIDCCRKTALMLALCQLLRDKYSLAAIQIRKEEVANKKKGGREILDKCMFLDAAPSRNVTNDIFTKEDGEFLVKHGALPEERIRAVETGGCPHAAIREDISINLGPLEELSNLYKADLLLCESGGEGIRFILMKEEKGDKAMFGISRERRDKNNLAANFSRELADFIIYIIDVSGGDKIPRKGGPGITQADLLVINKTDLAPAVGADLAVMERDALRMRDGGPFVFAQVKHGVGVEQIVNHVLQAWEVATGGKRH